MASSDLSSICTEANEILEDEKEEGEISLEDVSSSEDAPAYRYQPRLYGPCPHCLSTGHCATWCRSLTLDKKIFVRGKENRRHHYHHHHHHRHGHHQRAAAAAALPPGLLCKDLQPISSDSDLELVDLAKKKKARKKKRRKKSPSLSLSPSPPVDMAAICESIHRRVPQRHESPAVARKPQQQPKLHKSPPARKLSPQRMKKIKKPVGGASPLQSRGTAVTKLLKKVKKLEPFSTRSQENRSSLKDKLGNIIGGKKCDEKETVTAQLKQHKSPEVENRKVTKSQAVETKQRQIGDEEKKEEKKEGDGAPRQVTRESTPKESLQETPEETPPATKKVQQSPEPDEDLQLRVIALRSAVMKKHRTRIARAKKQQQLLLEQKIIDEPIPRIESPFTSSFNEDFPLLAEICSPGSPSTLDTSKQQQDIYCPEDMDLDSDMELDKEISMVLSGAEEDINNIADGDSPYSPTDDVAASPKATTDQPMDLSVYTPSKPTETSMHVNSRRNDSLDDASTLESRPYSPSDATVYDPELPGVLGAITPLQPPPLPPLGIMPIMPMTPMNLLRTYPIMPMSGFAPVNPMLTAPFIPFTAPATAAAATTSAAATTTLVPHSNTLTQLTQEFETDLDGSPLVPIEPKDTPNWKFIGEPLYLSDMNKLAMSGGLVPAPVLKCNKQLQRTPPAKKPSESLFRNADMRPVTIEDENKISGALFKPIKLPTPLKKAVTTQPAAAFDAAVQVEQPAADTQKQIWPELEQDLRELEELEEQENRRRRELEEKRKQEQREAEERKRQEEREAQEKKRREEREEAERRRRREREEADRRRRMRETPIRRLRKKSATPAAPPRARRRSARTPSRARDLYRHQSSRSSRDSEGKNKSSNTEDGNKEKPEEGKLCIDDDEQALREILLASLAKRKPNAKRKAALEAAKLAAATSNKENVQEPNISPSSTVNHAAAAPADLPTSSMPALQPLKRPASALLPSEQPPRKVVSASTRVVNNAIRYQNLLVQRKLFNQQKQALYKTRFVVNNGERSSSPRQSPVLDQRFVISLNEDTESEPEADEQNKSSPTKNRPLLAIPTSDFEQSVDQFLKGMRLQQECCLATTTTSLTITKPATPPMLASETLATTPDQVPVTCTAATIAQVAATAATTAAVPKERTVLKIPKPKSSILSVPATPQVVKHLPQSQQDEYRRLKQQIYQYEQLRLQKSKESTIAGAATTAQAQLTPSKPLDTTSSPSTPTSSSPAVLLASSTPKASAAKLMPKTQLIATSSPIVVTPTKIINATSSNVATKTTAVPPINSAIKVITSSTVTESPSSKPIAALAAKVTQPDPSQLKLLCKITDSLNSTKSLLNTAASKISSISSKSLKVLTMEQINRKTCQIQQKANCVVMDDLNKTGESRVEKKEIAQEEEEPSKEAPLAAAKLKDDKTKETWDDFKQVVSNEVETLSNLPTMEQKKLLTEAEEKLISKRHAVLDDITVMSGSLQEWEIERDATKSTSAKISSLREQLRIAEEKLQGQKVKLQKIQPKVTLYHEKINAGRKECFRLSKICNGLGQQIIGSAYKVPTAGAELLNNRIKEVATHTQKLRSKAVSVQSRNASKTAGRLLKNNSKAINVNPNSSVAKLNKKQINAVDDKVEESESFIKFSDIDNEENKNGACAAVSMIAKIRKSKYTFHKQNSKKPMDADSGNSLIKLASTKKLHGTNVNINRYKRINGKKFTKRRKLSEKERQSKVASATITNNATTTSSKKTKNQRYFNSANKISDNNVGTGKKTESNDAISKVEESKTLGTFEKSNPIETVEETPCKNEIINNNNNNSEIAKIGTVDESLNKSASSEKSDADILSQTIDGLVDEKTRASPNGEKIPAVQVGQSAHVTEKSTIETNSQTQSQETSLNESSVQNSVPSESKNIVDEIHTSNPNLNTAVTDAPERMEIENTNENVDTKMDKQSMNSGPTIVITANSVESDSVNNNNNNNNNINNSTSSVVNSSLDDYMKEMAVGDEYDNMCSKDYKSSASVASTEHSTTFDEEIRLLELASESDLVPNEITSNCQSSVVAVERETSAKSQSNARAEDEDHGQSEVIKAQQETLDDCRLITKAERDMINSQTSNVRIEDHTIQSRQNNISIKAYRPYESILKLVRAPRNDKTDGILCPFALMGTCINHECRYIHQPTSHCR